MEQVEKPTRWSLSDLLPEPVDQALDETFSKLEQALVKLEAARETLTSGIAWQDFNKVLASLESIALIKSKVEGYADLAFAEDTQNAATLNLRDRVDQVLTDSGNRVLFFEMWFKELSDEVTQNLIEHSGDLRYFLETMRRFKPFTLSETEEKMINLKDVNGIDAMVNLYEMITNHFTFSLEVGGEKQTLTRDQLASYFQSSLPEA
ncbi:MAG TPA: oligoendopeptidase F, partial [Anaerolineales bacterium]|nr:oligoendopeptidase F [Anaerolineales bacterium]